MNGQAKRLKPMLAYGLMTARFHTLLIRFQLAFPLSQARTPWTRQARLRSPNACVRAHDRSLPHLVIIGFRLTAPLSQAPSLGQDELTRRKCNLDTRGLTVRLHTLHNRAQTSNKAHDKFVPLRDCACADHLRPSLSPALLSGWSSHLVLIGFRLTTPLSQAPLLGQDELTRRKRDLDTRGLTVRLRTLP